MEHVILVDADDRDIGTAGKDVAHARGLLHRAFSVFVFDRDDALLLQRRARGKYHSGGLWSNTCCSHPRPGEATDAAAHRRLVEEMGFDCPLEYGFAFTYRVRLGPDLWEHEYDHVFVGRFDGTPRPAPGEVEAWRRVGLAALREELARSPEHFTYWFPIAFDGLVERGLVPAGVRG
jgi:isopentenyl-diphosphate delta-isomerase